MIPTMTASTPSRINEVDDDLSTDVGRGVDVDVDMRIFLSSGWGFPFVFAGCVAAAFGPRVWRDCRGKDCHQPVFLGRPRYGRVRTHHRLRRVTSASSTGQRGNGCL